MLLKKLTEIFCFSFLNSNNKRLYDFECCPKYPGWGKAPKIIINKPMLPSNYIMVE